MTQGEGPGGDIGVDADTCRNWHRVSGGARHRGGALGTGAGILRKEEGQG